MGKNNLKLNDRGRHTSVIESSKSVLKILTKNGVEVSPGRIEAGIKAKSQTIKIKTINPHLLEMVVTKGNNKQTFKLIIKNDLDLKKILTKETSLLGWNIRF